MLALSMNIWAGLAVLVSGRVPPIAIKIGRTAMIAVWCLALVLVPILGLGDWVHLFWTAQIPLVALFLCSGMLPFKAGWRGSEPSVELPIGSTGAARLFFAMLLTLGAYALILVSLFPAADVWQKIRPPFPESRGDSTWAASAPRKIDSPIGSLAEVALWGLGGPLPEVLEVQEWTEPGRGMDHLPRVVSAPLATTLIAAWLWIAFGVLSLAARGLKGQRAQACFGFLGAPLLGLIVALCVPFADRLQPFDPRFFFPQLSRRSGIWTSDPLVMRSYGPVLLAALFVAGLLAWQARRAARLEPDGSALKAMGTRPTPIGQS